MTAVDARIAARGGTRRDAKAAYSYPGMADDRDWRKTAVHAATAWYGCARCGQKFSGPHAVYAHIDKRHPRRVTRPVGGSLAPSGAGNGRVAA